MPLVPALVLLLTLGACFAYGAAVAGSPELLQLRSLRELCWALAILRFGSPAQRRQLQLVLLHRQTEATRRVLGYQPALPPPKQLLRPAPGLCDSCRAKAGERRYPLLSRPELDKARDRARQGYRVSPWQVEASWRRAELSPADMLRLGMISRAELRGQCQARSAHD